MSHIRTLYRVAASIAVLATTACDLSVSWRGSN
jgi:hypothetical protein